MWLEDYALGEAAAVAAYSIARSLRLNSADSAYLSRTLSTPTNQAKWTMSLWVKRGTLGANMRLFATGGSSDSADFYVYFNSSDQLVLSGGTTIFRTSARVFRDVSAWYHLVIAVDTTQGTEANKILVWVNGEAEALTVNATITTCGWNTAAAKAIGAQTTPSTYLNGYLADIYFVDGTAYTASDFGAVDGNVGQWLPKSPSVTFGNNGFWLSFANNASTTTLGYDDKGGVAGAHAGSNDWTLTNFSVAAGVGNDSLTDTPTKNYPVLNRLHRVDTGYTAAISNGNLDLDITYSSGSNAVTVPVTMALPTSGKWYWEVTVLSAMSGGGTGMGILDAYSWTDGSGPPNNYYMYVGSSGNKNSNVGGSSAYGATFTTNDIIGIAYDADTGKLFFSKNGTYQNSGDPVAGTNAAFTGLTGELFAFIASNASGTRSFSVNFGQRAFNTSAPSGFNALHSGNLALPAVVKPNRQFDVDLYTSNGAGRTKTGLAFQPDLAWFKGRSGATDHAIYDSVRGVQQDWSPNLANDEATQAQGLTAFTSDGYTIGTLAKLNTNAATYAAWLWKKGVTPGVDVVTYTGNGLARTIAHSLGVAPRLVIVKARVTAGTDQPAVVYSRNVGAANYLLLNNVADSAALSTVWNSTDPTSSVFSVGTAAAVNTSGDTYVAYLFAEVPGFSKIGAYTGNGNSDGQFVYCGFRPKFVLIKHYSGSISNSANAFWMLYDSARDPINPAQNYLAPHITQVETQINPSIDFLANGFKLKATGDSLNASGGVYLFMAFAEAPLKYANAR